jgi:hypothetical protein
LPKPKTGFSACAASQTRQVSSIATEKSPVESREHQDNANIHCQSFPEVVSKEREIHTDYDGYHHHHVNHYSCLSARFSHAGADSSVLQTFGDPAPRGENLKSLGRFPVRVRVSPSAPKFFLSFSTNFIPA